MAALIARGRQFSYDVARRMGRGEGTLSASMVKAYVCRSAEWVTREAMQLHGGMGYAEEFPVSRYFVDARVLSIFEGADETLCLRVIARRLAEQALERVAPRGATASAADGVESVWTCPIELGPCSNGEYDPVPLSPVAREARRRARDDSDESARRSGVSRRRFLRSLCGAATTLLAINACSEESTRQVERRRPGGTYTVPPTATVDPEAARAALAGDEFVFDVQGHFLDYSVEPGDAAGPRVLDRLPPTGLRRGRSARLLLPRPLHGGGVPSQRHVDGGALGVADRPRGQPDVGRRRWTTPAGRRRPRVTTNGCCSTRRRSRTWATSRPTSTR